MEKSKWTDLAFKVLSVLVIPLLAWGVTLQTGQAVQNEKISKLEAHVKDAETIKTSINTNANTLGRVEEKIDATNRRLDDIRGDLRRSLPPN